MHVPDGFLDSPTCLATGVVAAGGVAVALRLARRQPRSDDGVPMAALVATLVFAGQMVNVPVASGTSGHLMGAALAAVLVGPTAAIVCLAAVLAIQALVFADGGVMALGVNVTLLSLVAVVVAWAVFRGVLALAGESRATVPWAAAAAGLVSVPLAAVAFALLHAVGGTESAPFGQVLGAMVGWHLAIGVLEALITGVVVASVVVVRPDLVAGARLSGGDPAELAR